MNYRVASEVHHILRRTKSVDGQGIEFTLKQDIQKICLRCRHDLQKAPANLRERSDLHYSVCSPLEWSTTVSRSWRKGIERKPADTEAFDEVFRKELISLLFLRKNIKGFLVFVF